MFRIPLVCAYCFLILAISLPAVAGPLFPCPRATSSSNGQFLVLADVAVKPGPGVGATVLSISFQVFPKENFINARDKLSTPATYWTDWARWTVVLRPDQLHSEPGCRVPLISEDGQFLVLLLQIGPVSADEPVLQIYRRDHKTREGASSMNQGAFVKGLSLKVLWPTKKLPSSGMIWTDESLQWFAGGSFAFSSDSRQLIHKTRWGNTARINLMDGSIASNTCLALTCMDAPWADYE